MDDRDNPQEIVETDKAWLAGVIEGDGFITICFHQYRGATKERRFAVKPMVGFTNQDALLVDRVSGLLRVLGQKNAYIREVKSGYGGQSTKQARPCFTAVVVGMQAVLSILQAIGPYLVGDKLGRARLAIRFLESRLSRVREKGQGSGNPRYTESELLMIREFRQGDARKGRGPLVDIDEILNDYTRGIRGEVPR